MLMAIFCLFVVMLLAGALVQSLVARQRQVRVEQNQLQAFWLAESAAARAVSQLRAKPGYKGETWRVKAAELGGNHDGVMTIQVESDEDDAARRRVRIEAVYPEGTLHRVLHAKTLLVNVSEVGGQQ